MDERKSEQKQFYNFIRRDQSGDRQFHGNMKFYSIDRLSKDCVYEWLDQNVKKKRVLDFCCGRGVNTVWIAQHGASISEGIDISDGSISQAKEYAATEGCDDRCRFFVADAENTDFEDDSYDVIHVVGSLHHVMIDKAYKEMARLLKADGKCICREPLAYNPVFQIYRRLTPKMRTAWEIKHILKKKDIDLARKYFRRVEVIDYFHLTVLLAVPFRNTKYFKKILQLFERIDSVIVKIPLVRWLSWKIVFTLSDPIKDVPQ